MQAILFGETLREILQCAAVADERIVRIIGILDCLSVNCNEAAHTGSDAAFFTLEGIELSLIHLNTNFTDKTGAFDDNGFCIV